MDKPKIFIVNCYADNHRHARGNALFAPHTMVTGVLAGQLNTAKVDVRVWCEFKDGPIKNLKLLAWPDLVEGSGLNTAYDRMKHLAAYARTVNPRVVLAAGGPAVRMLPRLSRRYFDHVCTGDVEQIVSVVDEVFGPGHGAEQPTVRFDLMAWRGPLGYAESSRNCNFRCSFCSMSAEDRPFTNHALDDLHRQLAAQSHRHCVMMLDQNFYGGPRDAFFARLEVMKQLHQQKKLHGWSALVTADFFKDRQNLRRVKEAGCIGFFSGVESFNPSQISAFNKKQNLIVPQFQMIQDCLEEGLVFHYGLVFDLYEQKVSDIEAELDAVLRNPFITLPSFLSLAIPLLGTPLFRQRLAQGALLPNLKLRDMDGRSVMTRTLDSCETATHFAARMDRGLMSKAGLAKHAWSLFWRYRRGLTPIAMTSAMADALAMAWPRTGSNGRDGFRQAKGGRTYFASTESVGTLYKPWIPVDARYESFFTPLHVTDEHGKLAPDLQEDLGYMPLKAA